MGVTNVVDIDYKRCHPPHDDHIAHTIRDIAHDVGEQYKVRIAKEFVLLTKTQTIGVSVSIMGKTYVFAKVDKQ